MKTYPRKGRAAFTLLEMTLAISLSLGIASAIVGLLQQQLSFTSTLNHFHFLREEAPQINTLLGTVINKADSYRIYASRNDAMASSGAIRSDGRALRMRLRNPDGTAAHAVVAFETAGSVNRLNFYFRNHNQASWPSSPSWTISSKPALVDFDNTSGILLITLTGPKGEQITYAGNPE